MASIISVSTFVFSFLLLIPCFSADTTNSPIEVWCNQTPFPQQCLYHIKSAPNNLISKYHCLELLESAAWHTCSKVQNELSGLSLKCQSQMEKAAWKDCVELYSDAASLIHRCFDSNIKRTPDDVRTWLSGALSSLDTCVQGFKDFGIGDYENIFPPISNNVSFLLVDCLAMNAGNVRKSSIMPSQKEINDDFPHWVKPRERKLLQAATNWADAVVAKDGSGEFGTLGAAVAAATERSRRGPYVIYVKNGTCEENVIININNLMLVGDGIGKTVITGHNNLRRITTYDTATVGIRGNVSGFYARGITFQNTAGPNGNQAVAFRSSADLSVLYQCSFEGFQDTLYVHNNRHFYRECHIYGTVDFIFGYAAAVLQNCTIYPRYPPNLTNTITAHRMLEGHEGTGIFIHNSWVTAAPDLRSRQKSVRTYLGRPWGENCVTVFMKTYLDDLIDPAGWIAWNGNDFLDSLYYGEYDNNGTGSSTTGRVKWKGYHVITSKAEASKFAPGNIIEANDWFPVTHVPFTPDV